jgi:hypothetical protein
MGLRRQEIRLVLEHQWTSPISALVLWKELWKSWKADFDVVFSHISCGSAHLGASQKKSAIAQITGVDISRF